MMTCSFIVPKSKWKLPQVPILVGIYGLLTITSTVADELTRTPRHKPHPQSAAMFHQRVTIPTTPLATQSPETSFPEPPRRGRVPCT